MKAAVIRGPADIAVETVDTPTIRDNEILVKVVACGICGSDLHFYKAGPTAIPKERTILLWRAVRLRRNFVFLPKHIRQHPSVSIVMAQPA